MPKRRLSVRLSPKVHAALLSAANRDVSASALVEAALVAYFDPAADSRAGVGAILHRFDAFDLQQGRIEKELAIAVEMTAQFALYWMIATEPIPEKEKAAAQARGQRRYRAFEELVARKLLCDERFSKRILGDLAATATSRREREKR